MSTLVTALILVVLIAFSAFFSSSETAFLSISKVTLRQIQKEKLPKARYIANLKSDMDRLLTTILIGNNFVNNFASSTATALAVSLFGDRGVGAATVVMTVLIILFGEILPKTVATNKPVKLSQNFAIPLGLLQKIMFPLVWIFAKLSKAIGSLVDKIWKSDTPLVTEEELKTLFAVGNAEGTLENDEKEMLYKIFEFTDLRVRDITRHRSFVKSVSASATFTQVAEVFAATGYSRLPVYEEKTEGDKNQYIGLLHYKALLFYHGEKNKPDFARLNMRKVLFVPETKSAVSLLHTFKTEKVNFAIVVNEHGSNSGIVTMDDVLNAVMGRITDEYAKETPPEKRIKILSATEFILPGDLRLNDVNEIFKLQCESEDFDTLGGWLLEQFGYLPSVGEVFSKKNNAFIVEDVSHRRIQTIRLKRTNNTR
ncbi:MAG: HlyC/CorC family transporter [Spirochaetaceae bacterium]|nr:HlyC/CorC family transporter [Spirochaetaceae bacterium]